MTFTIQGHVEGGLELWLVEAREGCARIGRLELRGQHVPAGRAEQTGNMDQNVWTEKIEKSCKLVRKSRLASSERRTVLHMKLSVVVETAVVQKNRVVMEANVRGRSCLKGQLSKSTVVVESSCREKQLSSRRAAVWYGSSGPEKSAIEREREDAEEARFLPDFALAVCVVAPVHTSQAIVDIASEANANFHHLAHL